jgi:hypothetical protein
MTTKKSTDIVFLRFSTPYGRNGNAVITYGVRRGRKMVASITILLPTDLYRGGNCEMYGIDIRNVWATSRGIGRTRSFGIGQALITVTMLDPIGQGNANTKLTSKDYEQTGTPQIRQISIPFDLFPM